MNEDFADLSALCRWVMAHRQLPCIEKLTSLKPEPDENETDFEIRAFKQREIVAWIGIRSSCFQVDYLHVYLFLFWWGIVQKRYHLYLNHLFNMFLLLQDAPMKLMFTFVHACANLVEWHHPGLVRKCHGKMLVLLGCFLKGESWDVACHCHSFILGSLISEFEERPELRHPSWFGSKVPSVH